MPGTKASITKPSYAIAAMQNTVTITRITAGAAITRDVIMAVVTTETIIVDTVTTVAMMMATGIINPYNFNYIKKPNPYRFGFFIVMYCSNEL
jgi:hypothetical protein